MQNPEKAIVSHVITAIALCVVAFCFLLDARFQVGASHEVLKYIASGSAGIAVTSFIAAVVDYKRARAFIVELVIFAVFLLMFWGGGRYAGCHGRRGRFCACPLFGCCCDHVLSDVVFCRDHMGRKVADPEVGRIEMMAGFHGR